jgi:hypothetical protein
LFARYSGVPLEFQPIIAATTPDVVVEVFHENKLCLQYLNDHFNIHIDLTLGEPVKANLLGFGEKEVAIIHQHRREEKAGTGNYLRSQATLWLY